MAFASRACTSFDTTFDIVVRVRVLHGIWVNPSMYGLSPRQLRFEGRDDLRHPEVLKLFVERLSFLCFVLAQALGIIYTFWCLAGPRAPSGRLHQGATWAGKGSLCILHHTFHAAAEPNLKPPHDSRDFARPVTLLQPNPFPWTFPAHSFSFETEMKNYSHHLTHII